MIKTDLKVDEENDNSEVDERVWRRDDVSLLVQNEDNGCYQRRLGIAVELKIYVIKAVTKNNDLHFKQNLVA